MRFFCYLLAGCFRMVTVFILYFTHPHLFNENKLRTHTLQARCGTFPCNHLSSYNKSMLLGSMDCFWNAQNMYKKNRGKNLLSRSLPRVSLIISILYIILLLLPAPLLTGTDFQQHILGLGNIWETFRACTAHSASMCQSINFYSLLLSFLFFRVNTYRFTCILARSANFACKINE